MEIKKENDDYFSIKYYINSQQLSVNRKSKINGILDNKDIDLILLKNELINLSKKRNKKKKVSLISIIVVVLNFTIQLLVHRGLTSYMGYVNVILTFAFQISLYELFDSKKKISAINSVIEIVDEEIEKELKNKPQMVKKKELINVENKTLELGIINNRKEDNFLKTNNNCKKKIKRKKY